MKIQAFFKVLNKKIDKYNKTVNNPFCKVNIPVTLIWIEDMPKNNVEK